jgi:uridine kinase
MEITNKKPIIILISGKARSGKSFSAEFIKEACQKNGQKAVIVTIANYLKDLARDYFGWDEEAKPRDLLQHLGTDIIRKK